MILSKEEIILFTAFVAGAFENRLFVINKFHINTSRRTRTTDCWRNTLHALMANANKKLMPLLPAITMKDDKTKTQKQPGFVIIRLSFPVIRCNNPS